MKTFYKIFTLTFIFLFTSQVYSQSNFHRFYYQAVIRDAAGQEIKNKDVELKLDIVQQNGVVRYTETRNVTTNQFGLVNRQKIWEGRKF